MRKIETEILRAIEAMQMRGPGFRNIGNSSVEVDGMGRVRVCLHGNLIYWTGADGHYFTMRGWPTVTTRSRLNALLGQVGGGISQRDYGQFYSGGWNTGPTIEIEDSKVYRVDAESGELFDCHYPGIGCSNYPIEDEGELMAA